MTKQKVVYVQPHQVDEEHDLRIAIMEQELAEKLWNRVAIPDALVHVALAIPPSTWHALKSAGVAPPRFKLGRRVYVKTNDLRMWLDQQPVSDYQDASDQQPTIPGAPALPEFGGERF